MAVDLETVILMSTYRVGYLPPVMGSLAPGELFIEAMPAGGGVPRIWVGTATVSGIAGDAALVVPPPTEVISVIDLDPIDNPSPSDEVHIVGTVNPGAKVELAAMQGPNQVNAWSPWDATIGDLDILWYLPPGDNYQIRVRMREAPGTYTDSNLFAVVEPYQP